MAIATIESDSDLVVLKATSGDARAAWLAEVIDRWVTLPEAVRLAVGAIVRSVE